MKARLTSDGHLASSEEAVFERFRSMVELPGRVVLELGGRFEPGAAAGVAAWWSVDPRNPAAPPGGPVRTVRGVGSNVPLPDGSVDLVFSCNAFQHIHDLPETLNEMARVLRKGGRLYANFGPVWSAPDGSHIEDLRVGGERYDFWTHALLPPWAHLVFDEDELAELLSEVHTPELASAVSRYVFHSTWINRLFLDDYLRIFQRCPLAIEFLGGCSTFGYDYSPPDIDHPLARRLRPEGVLAEVRKRHGADKAEILTRDLEILLRKD